MSTPQIAAVPESFNDILHSTALALVSTLGPKGEPQTSPVWFDWDGQRLSFSHTKARQKYRNLLRDPRISVVIVDPTNPFNYLELRGTVSIADDPDNAFIDRMSKKYTGNEHYQFHQPGDERVVITVTPLGVHPRR